MSIRAHSLNQFFIDDKFACGWAEVAERQKDLVVPDVISLLMGSDTVGGVTTKLIERNTTIFVAQAAFLFVKGFSRARSCVAARHFTAWALTQLVVSRQS